MALTPIDDDLAEEMKDEIERKIKVGAINEHDDLTEKVQRILTMFNVSNLDEIVEVNSLPRQIEETTESSISIELKENREILFLEGAIEKLHQEIGKKQEELSEQRKIIIYISEILLMAMNNVRSIQLLLKEHNMNADSMQEEVYDLYDKLKKLQFEKIKHLQLLREIAKADLKQVEITSLIGEVVNDKFTMDNPRTEDQEKFYKIDRSKYDTYPLQKIIGIHKIKSLTELSDQQAAKLLQLQEQRNSS